MIINCLKYLGFSLFNPLKWLCERILHRIFSAYTHKHTHAWPLGLFYSHSFALSVHFFPRPLFACARTHVVSIIYFKPCISMKHAFNSKYTWFSVLAMAFVLARAEVWVCARQRFLAIFIHPCGQCENEERKNCAWNLSRTRQHIFHSQWRCVCFFSRLLLSLFWCKNFPDMLV